jgi:NAD(P)-dependent dehydrogenase (short-subunit alcohol dehydrogenase family)
MFDRVEAEWGPVGILVNNAGIDHEARLDELTEADWDRVLAVNLKGPFLCLRRAIRTMGPGGSIVNVSSVHDHVPRRGSAHYCASKAGLVMLTKTAALELGPRGIRVNAVSPGAILTDMNRDLIEREIGPARWREWIPVGRVGRAEEVGALTAFLASDASSYVTGTVLPVDGGVLTS